MRKLGILGGMGPEATAEFYLRLIRLFQLKDKAILDSDYPEIFIYNLPLPDVVEKVVEKGPIVSSLRKGIGILQKAGAEFFVCPCNTANTYLYSMDIGLPYINMIYEAARFAEGRTLILGTAQTIRSGCYQKALKAQGNLPLSPSEEEQGKITAVLLNILSGRKLEQDRILLREIVKKSGCDSAVLGCTELPLLVKQEEFIVKIVDTLQILAEASYSYCRGERQ